MTIDEAREIIAVTLCGYKEGTVGPDCDGNNAGILLVPPEALDGYAYPPRGPIGRLWHVPHWHNQPATLDLIRRLRRRGATVYLGNEYAQVIVEKRTLMFSCDYETVGGNEWAAVVMAAAEACQRGMFS